MTDPLSRKMLNTRQEVVKTRQDMYRLGVKVRDGDELDED
jgi:hypothetical protein